MILYLLYLLLSIRQVNIIFFCVGITYSVGWPPFRGLAPTVVLYHRYAVLYGILRYRGLTPTAVLFHRDAVLHGKNFSCPFVCFVVLSYYLAIIMHYAL